MKRPQRKIKLIGSSLGVYLGGSILASAASFTLISGSNLDSNGWSNDDGGPNQEPGAGDTGLINSDGVYNSANWVNSGAILMTGGNIVSAGPSRNFNFSSATGDGSFTITGGTIDSRGILANRNTINLLGGTWTVGSGTTGSNVGAGNGGLLTIGGDFVLLNSRTTAHTYSDGDVVFNSDWTGSWENDTVDLAGWRTELTSGNYSLDDTTITGAVFDANFQVVGNTLSLVPEPSSAALVGLGGLALILRRRK